jgi:hypothetical protein
VLPQPASSAVVRARAASTAASFLWLRFLMCLLPFLLKTLHGTERHSKTHLSKNEAFLRAEWQHKKTPYFQQVLCGTTNSS